MTERLYYYSDSLNGSDHEPDAEDRKTSTKEEANLISSLCDDGFHKPILDIDFPCKLEPSSTEGHYHLYIEKPMTQAAYLNLVDALAAAGIVSKFYAKAARVRGATFCRPPWVKKEKK